MLSVLHKVPETVRCVLLIAHNPGIHELSMTLVGAQGMSQDTQTTRRLAEGYPTGALAVFSIAGPWSTLGEGGGRLLRFVAPRDLSGDLPELAV